MANLKDQKDDLLKTYGLCGLFTLFFIAVFIWSGSSHDYMLKEYKWVAAVAYLFTTIGAFSWVGVVKSFKDYAMEKYRVWCMVSFGLAGAFFGGFHAQYLADLSSNLIK